MGSFYMVGERKSNCRFLDFARNDKSINAGRNQKAALGWAAFELKTDN
jgi:hypothetical protein